MMLHRFHGENNAFPRDYLESFPRAERGKWEQDGWGRPYVYEIVGEGFYLVSYGRDGKSDGPRQKFSRKSKPVPNMLGYWDADVIISEQGFIQNAHW
jgi:hypothetical protein